MEIKAHGVIYRRAQRNEDAKCQIRSRILRQLKVSRPKAGTYGRATIFAMQPNSKKLGTSAIVWPLVWALAIVATAFLFKGNPAEYWIEAGLIVGALTFVVLKRRHASAAAR